MKNLFFLFILVSSQYLNAQFIANTESVQIKSKVLKQDRELLIYTPQYYNEDILVSYDVIYVFDAQNREFIDFTHSITSFISNAEKKFIVVGITSPYNEKLDYARNNDLLPKLSTKEAKEKYGKYSGNAGNFMKFIEKEVLVYIDSNYRITNNKIAIGHSLSASFLIYSILKSPDLFDSYLAVSPNLAYDGELLANGLMSFNYDKVKNNLFLYLSNANEGKGYWQSWLPARKKVYSFIKKVKKENKFYCMIKEFPKENHWSVFAPSITFGLKECFKYMDNKKIEFSAEKYQITIKVKVPDKNDEVYITGNQESLGNWNPSVVKMENVSDNYRQIELMVQAPVELKITRGNWETEGEIRYNGGFNNLKIDPKKADNIELEILGWTDRMD